MADTLRVLMLEDVPSDAEINERCLRDAGLEFESERVDTREEFETALRDFAPDLILVDYTLPSFDGLTALHAIKRSLPDVPAVVVTGSINEETAVECMKAGAADYVLKDHLARLPRAVTSALERVAELREKRLVEAELFKLHRAVETSDEIMFITDKDGVFTYVNPQFTEVYGYEMEEVVGEATPRILKSGHRDREYYRRFWESLTNSEVVRGDFVNKRKDGTSVSVEGSASPVLDESGATIAYLAVQRDVTERRQAEEDITYLASLPEQNPNPVIEIDLSGHLAYMNPAAQQLFPDLQSEVNENPMTADLETAVVALSRKDNQLLEREVEVDGRVFEEKLCYIPNKSCIRIFAHDITERRRLESQLRQAQKMEAVGLLTGGIAHDFNNVLTVIMANADLISAVIPTDSEELRLEINELQEAAKRGAMMIKKLLGFSRRERLDLEPVNLGSVVQDLTRVLRHLLPRDIAMEVERQEPLSMVEADLSAVEQILMNLATNARDAMPDGGVLRFRTFMAKLDEASRAAHPWVLPGEYVCTAVSDSGHGMDEVTQERVFEPFFTTKTRGDGTGLGMPMIYGLMKQHGGFVHVYSEPGYGTVIKLYFPVQRSARGTAETEAGGGTRSQFAGAETILVADDEASIRRATKQVLEGYGYTVYLSSDGQEALEIYQQHADSIDLVLSDIIMPRLGGRELYETIRAKGLNVEFLFMSGYSAPEVEQGASMTSNVPILQKPWAAIDLARAVREALDRGGN